MKKIRKFEVDLKIILLLVFTILASFAITTDLYAEGKKLLVVGEQFPPFEFKENGKAVGIDIDIINHIFKEMNVDFEIRILPWTRAWQMIEEGKADAVLSTSRKEKRRPYVYYPKEDMWVSEYLFFVRKDKKQLHFKGYQEIKEKKLKIGIIRGNSYDKRFWEVFPAQKNGDLNECLEETDNVELNFKKLAAGRIDLYIIDKTVGCYMLSKLDLEDKISFYDKVLFSKGYPMPFSKQSRYPDLKQITDTFEKKLAAFKTMGKYEEILRRWITSDNKDTS